MAYWEIQLRDISVVIINDAFVNRLNGPNDLVPVEEVGFCELGQVKISFQSCHLPFAICVFLTQCLKYNRVLLDNVFQGWRLLLCRQSTWGCRLPGLSPLPGLCCLTGDNNIIPIQQWQWQHLYALRFQTYQDHTPPLCWAEQQVSGCSGLPPLSLPRRSRKNLTGQYFLRKTFNFSNHRFWAI